jgi:hypothetical protein
MVTKPEIGNRYPRKIELDESLGRPVLRFCASGRAERLRFVRFLSG